MLSIVYTVSHGMFSSYNIFQTNGKQNWNLSFVGTAEANQVWYGHNNILSFHALQNFRESNHLYVAILFLRSMISKDATASNYKFTMFNPFQIFPVFIYLLCGNTSFFSENIGMYERAFNHQTFQEPKMEVLTYISSM